MKVPFPVARGSIRFSLGRYNTIEEIDHTLDVLMRVLGQLMEKPGSGSA
jgi:cysteine sulfinate desulfinase/cysteine desulfurase-like protein